METTIFTNDLEEFLKKEVRINHFSYVSELNTKKLVHGKNFTSYMGYSRSYLKELSLKSILHHTEYEEITQIISTALQFEMQHAMIAGKPVYMYMQQMKRANGSFIQVLNRMRIIRHGATNYSINLCIDVTSPKLYKNTVFDVILPEILVDKRPQILEYFQDKLYNNKQILTDRELEVLKIWSQYESVKIASEQLSISVRTFETHLRNMRRKLGVRRSVDVLIHVKEIGLM